MKVSNLFFPIIVFFLVSCKTVFVPNKHNAALLLVNEAPLSDSVSPIATYLQPFRDSLSLQMNTVLGKANGNFVKEKPSGSLGNVVCDAIYWKSKALKQSIACVLYNYGGLRIPQISAGEITTGKIYELLPFENELVFMTIKGSIFKQWLQHAAKAGGWPIQIDSSIYSFEPIVGSTEIKGKRSASLQIFFSNNEIATHTCDTVLLSNNSSMAMQRCLQIHDDTMYTIATNDYIANGGDQCDFLRMQKRQETGILIRDIMMEYIKHQKNLEAKDEIRMVIQ